MNKAALLRRLKERERAKRRQLRLVGSWRDDEGRLNAGKGLRQGESEEEQEFCERARCVVGNCFVLSPEDCDL